MRADGTDTRELTRTTTGFDVRPTWSSDWETIAFVRTYAGGEIDITMVPAAGGATRRVAIAGRPSMPAWSPAGDLIAFVQDAPIGENLSTMRPDGRGIRLRTVEPTRGAD